MTTAGATEVRADGRSVEARGISLTRSGRCVLEGVDLDVRPGEVVALIGPNGAGKTTLLECLVGLRRADRGRVSFAGRTLERFSDRCRVFSFMPDDAEIPPEVTVAELLAHAQRFGGVPPSLASDLETRLGIANLRSARAGALSRGERRRVALFQAFATVRPVVVLDEPFGAFDPRQLRDVLDVVRSRTAAGVALIASVHQMSDAEKIADRVLLLSAGRVVAFDRIDGLRTRVSRPGASLEELFLALLESRSEAHDAAT